MSSNNPSDRLENDGNDGESGDSVTLRGSIAGDRGHLPSESSAEENPSYYAENLRLRHQLQETEAHAKELEREFNRLKVINRTLKETNTELNTSLNGGVPTSLDAVYLKLLTIQQDISLGLRIQVKEKESEIRRLRTANSVQEQQIIELQSATSTDNPGGRSRGWSSFWNLTRPKEEKNQ